MIINKDVVSRSRGTEIDRRQRRDRQRRFPAAVTMTGNLGGCLISGQLALQITRRAAQHSSMNWRCRASMVSIGDCTKPNPNQLRTSG
jgi:hypothetical protein